MIPPAAAAMLDFMTALTFSIGGLSKDKQVYSALGSGFFVAPYTAVTATHVVRGLWDILEMPWRQGKYPKTSVEPAFFLAASQQVDRKNPFLAAQWEITGVTPLEFTDIAFLNLVPRNEVASKFFWPKPFPSLELLPPPKHERVWSFGYPGATYEHTPGKSVVDVSTEPTLIEGAVIGQHPQGRGSWRFPQFEVTCGFEPGMSGGPVVHEKQICGVISYGPKLQDGSYGSSFAADLWPILGAENRPGLDPRTAANPILDMIKNGTLMAPGWKKLQSHITQATTDSGHSIITLKQ